MANTNEPGLKRAKSELKDSIRYRKNKYAAPLGGIYLILVAIGFIALLVFSFNFTKNLLDNTGEKSRFEQIIRPVLMFDPVPFEKPTDADELFLLQSSLWSTLLGEKRNSYQIDALNRLTVPASDVDVSCARLFGTEVALRHQSFGDYETNYIYDANSKAYFVPVAGQVGLYTPSVERVVKKGDVFLLTVGYVPPANAWTQGASGQIIKPTPDKHMIYELLKVKNHYVLTAIRDVPPAAGNANAVSQGTQRQ
jgi:hypothetical protein